MLYYSSVLKDSPVGFWKMDETSGSIAYDSSGCGNNGSYGGGINKVQIPLVPGGMHANVITSTQTVSFPVTKDFSGQSGVGGFGIDKTEDNDFSLELWFHPKNITGLTPLLADEDGIGIYWENGNIIFKVESERIDYTVPYKNKSFHVVAIYTPTLIKLYVDSDLVASKEIKNVVFSNPSLVIKSGPALSGEKFLIDSVAIYRYGLSPKQIKIRSAHKYINIENQIVYSNFGELFKSKLQSQSQPDSFAYPYDVSFDFFENDNIGYKFTTKTLYLKSSSGYFTGTLFFPYWKEYISSKIEWFGGEGIRVYVSQSSTSGPWVECQNGSYIPGINLGSTFTNNSNLYVKVEFESDDISLYVPELSYLGIYLYEDKKLYSQNGMSFITVSQPSSGPSWDVDFSNREDQVISRHYDNGIRSRGAGFYIDTDNNNRCIEMIMVPDSLSSGYLFYNKTGGVEYSVSWASNGAITKSNISELHINGQDISTQTNISNYINVGEPNYIFIKTSANITGQIWINTKSDNGTRSGTLPDNLYNIISIYPGLNVDPTTNYNLYIGNNVISVSDPGFEIEETGIKTYDFDWQLSNNI